jgi:hypothetical protein
VANRKAAVVVTRRVVKVELRTDRGGTRGVVRAVKGDRILAMTRVYAHARQAIALSAAKQVVADRGWTLQRGAA